MKASQPNGKEKNKTKLTKLQYSLLLTYQVIIFFVLIKWNEFNWNSYLSSIILFATFIVLS